MKVTSPCRASAGVCDVLACCRVHVKHRNLKWTKTSKVRVISRTVSTRFTVAMTWQSRAASHKRRAFLTVCMRCHPYKFSNTAIIDNVSYRKEIARHK